MVFKKNANFFAENWRKSPKIIDHNIVFFAENWRKSPKFVIITSTPFFFLRLEASQEHPRKPEAELSDETFEIASKLRSQESAPQHHRQVLQRCHHGKYICTAPTYFLKLGNI
jgi:hypothetical protein